MKPRTLAARVDDPSSDAPPPADRPRTPAEHRAERVSKAILLALGIAVLLAAVAGAGLGTNGTTSGEAQGPRLGGDFPAFYGAGSIVWSGDIDQLYDPARQQEAQDELGLDGYLAFAYPPHVAIAYAPLSVLDFQLAYVVHTVLMAAAFVGTIFVLSGLVPMLDRWRWPIAAAGLTFYPVFTAVGGGQNAPLTLLLVALVWRGLADDRQWVAGLAAGLMLYRPQYALPVIGLMLLARRWRAVEVATLVGVATWIGTALALGAGWLGTWFDQVLPFVERDAEVNAANSISLLGFLQAVWGADARPAVIVGAVGAAVVVVTLMALWSRPDRFVLADRVGAMAIGMTLISPHTMFYDATLLLLAGAAVLWHVGPSDSLGRTGTIRLMALTWVGALLHVANDGLGASPLAFVVAIAFVAFVVAAVGRVDGNPFAAPEAEAANA